MAMEKAAAYITLLDIMPDHGKKLSDAQITSMSKQLQDIDLNEVKRIVTTVFHEESEENKKWAQRISGSNPIDLEERARMIRKTHEIADKIIRVYDNLDHISRVLKATTERNLPPKEILSEPKRRFSSAGSLLFKKSGTN